MSLPKLTRLDRRLARLEAKQAQTSSKQWDYTWDQLRISCSCPPDTSIHIRAGFVQQGSFWVTQETIWFPGLSIDFSSSTQFVNYDGRFSTAGYYRPMLLRYDYNYFYALRDGDTVPPIDDYSGVEHATSSAAEAEADGWFDGTHELYDGYLPLYVIILQNNGMANADGSVLPIDPVNRGRSYLWRDVRPRNICPFFE